jgi:hypothetical protein
MPDAGGVVRRGAGRALGLEIADHVALHHRQPAALVEIARHDAQRRAVNRVVGDDRALEPELRMDRNLAEVGRGVAGDLNVGGGIAAHAE